jgi:hypothetical protein
MMVTPNVREPQVSQRKSKIALQSNDERDVWVPDPEFIREFGISNMTKMRYDVDPELVQMGWPPPMRIKERNFRSRRIIEKFKANMLKRAIEQRRKLFPKQQGAEAAE